MSAKSRSSNQLDHAAWPGQPKHGCRVMSRRLFVNDQFRISFASGSHRDASSLRVRAIAALFPVADLFVPVQSNVMGTSRYSNACCSLVMMHCDFESHVVGDADPP
jgi:hypothetical protein